MQEGNQGPRPESEPATSAKPPANGETAAGGGPVAAPGSPLLPPADEAAAPLAPPATAAAHRARRGLVTWFAIALSLGIAGAALGTPELGASVSLAILLAVSQAAEVVPGWGILSRAMEWVVQLSGVLLLGSWLLVIGSLPRGSWTPLALVYIAAAILVLLATVRPGTGDALARSLDRQGGGGYVMTLVTRIVLVSVLLCPPLWVLFRRLPELTELDLGRLLDARDLAASLAGYNLLALAGVGWLVRRDFRGSLQRLGLARLRRSHWAWVAVGTAGLLLLASAGEWAQRTWLPRLYEADRSFDRALAGSLSRGGMILLGVTAGVGEELTMRGALQPRLGILTTSVFFALLHVQYSIAGIAFIFLLSLGLGWLRQRTSTSVTVLVHALYDVLALFLTAEDTGPV